MATQSNPMVTSDSFFDQTHWDLYVPYGRPGAHGDPWFRCCIQAQTPTFPRQKLKNTGDSTVTITHPMNGQTGLRSAVPQRSLPNWFDCSDWKHATTRQQSP